MRVREYSCLQALLLHKCKRWARHRQSIIHRKYLTAAKLYFSLKLIPETPIIRPHSWYLEPLSLNREERKQQSCYVMAWLCERRFRKFVHVDVVCRRARCWPDRCGRHSAVTAGKRNVWCGGGGSAGLPPLSVIFEWIFLSTLNWAAALWIVWRQATRSAARLDHCLWSMLQAAGQWPAHRSWYFKIMASILETSACSRTSTLVIKSLQWMLRMVRKQRWWKRSRRRMWLR